MSDDEQRVRPDAKIEDIIALMELNKAEYEAMTEGIKKKKAQGEKLAEAAASFHGDEHLQGVFEKDKK